MNLKLLFLGWVLWAATGASDPVPSALELNQKAVRLLEQGQFDRAITLFQRAVRTSHRDTVIVANLAVARNNRGLQELRGSRYARAIDDFGAAARLVPGNVLFPVHLGYAYLLSRDFPRAEAVLLRARGEHPREPKVYDFLGFLYYSRDELESAVRMYETRLRIEADPWASKQLERARRELSVSGNFVDRSNDDFTLKFLGNASNYRIADDVLAMLLDARSTICADLGHYPLRRTTVLLYSDRGFRKATGAHGWVGGLYDGKIRLPVKDFRRQRQALMRTVRHEYTHRVIADMAPSCPIWVNEGLAQWFEDGGDHSHRAIRELIARGYKPPSFAAMPKSFASQTNVGLVKVQYAASRSFIAFLRERYGLGALRSFLLSLGREDGLDVAMRKDFGGTLTDMEVLWRREVLR